MYLDIMVAYVYNHFYCCMIVLKNVLNIIINESYSIKLSQLYTKFIDKLLHSV